ncbi:OLC1v1003725C2 [Oldenlandia corymbosa var. corymbosa]|nr:OLC1v1003725C2 [Oldenlandia corymbosa var. corymbosa]
MLCASTYFQHQWLPACSIVLIYFSSSIISSSSATQFHKIPKLGIVQRHGNQPAASAPKQSLPKEFEPHFYEQTLDHFNYNPRSYSKFKQYYVINSKYWGGADSNSPILAYLGEESSLDGDIPVIGFLKDNAPRFKALLVYIEHRFYGKSNPLGTMEKSLGNKDIRGYFNSAQALADYAEILLYLTEKLSAHHSPIIVIGGSYGGMLASWFRLKYPHIALGALASSAPILYFDDITPQNGYYSRVTQDFQGVSSHCYQTIRESWSMIDKVASKPNGLTFLSQKFKTCARLNKSSELKDFLDSTYASAAQYNAPPRYPVTQFCKGADKSPDGSGVLDRIFAGLVSLYGNLSCYDTSRFSYPTETNIGYAWQTCSEMVMPIGRGSNDTMFPAAPFILKDFMESCKSTYGVSPRPHWITTYYGGHDIKLILKRFGSNIIFSNGLRDPYSTGG